MNRLHIRSYLVLYVRGIASLSLFFFFHLVGDAQSRSHRPPLPSLGCGCASSQAATTPPAAGGVPTPGKGTSAEEWVPRGNTAPKGNPLEGVSSVAGEGDDAGVSGMEVDGEDEQEKKEKEVEEKEVDEDAPLALVSVMTHRNGCKLLLRLLAPDHTG